MIKLHQSDTEAICKTILVGLPAVGKSTIADIICAKFEQDTGIKLENVNSDLRFRKVREDKNSPILKKFMREHNIPEEDFPLLIKTTGFMQKYGEPCFRDFESDVIVAMLENGEFKGKMPNLGGKAILHPRTAAAFKKAGYHIIYLKSDVNNIAQHVTKDFEAKLDGAVITRSNINDPILEHLKTLYPDIAEKSLRRFVEEVFSNTQKHLNRRKIPFSEWARINKRNKALVSRCHGRIEARDEKAKEIMSMLDMQRNAGYEKAANRVVMVSGNLKEDVQAVLGAILNNNVLQMVRNAKTQARI